jgi:hypothetical protein
MQPWTAQLGVLLAGSSPRCASTEATRMVRVSARARLLLILICAFGPLVDCYALAILCAGVIALREVCREGDVVAALRGDGRRLRSFLLSGFLAAWLACAVVKWVGRAGRIEGCVHVRPSVGDPATKFSTRP